MWKRSHDPGGMDKRERQKLRAQKAKESLRESH